MSQDVFLERQPEITAAVEVQLQNSASRRRFEVAAIYTAKRGELLARILRTNFGIVAVINTWLPEGIWERYPLIQTGDRTQDDGAPVVNGFRSTEAEMTIQPLTGKLDTELLLTSRSRREPYVVTEEDVLRRIARNPYADGREFSRSKGLVFG
jgi:hypothetical protein